MYNHNFTTTKVFKSNDARVKFGLNKRIINVHEKDGKVSLMLSPSNKNISTGLPFEYKYLPILMGNY